MNNKLLLFFIITSIYSSNVKPQDIIYEADIEASTQPQKKNVNTHLFLY